MTRPVMRAAMAGLLPEEVRMRPRKALFDSIIVDSLAGRDGALIRRLLTGPARAAPVCQISASWIASCSTATDAAPAAVSLDVSGLAATTAECWLRAQANPGDELSNACATGTPARVTLREVQPAD